MRFHADGTHTLSAEPSPYTAEMSIGTATCMLMGYKRPAYLKSIDRLTADAKTTALLERLIPTARHIFQIISEAFHAEQWQDRSLEGSRSCFVNYLRSCKGT